MKSTHPASSRISPVKRISPSKAISPTRKGGFRCKKLLCLQTKELFAWRSGRDSNPRTAFDRHTISSRARYDRFDTTPSLVRGGAPAPRFGMIVVGRSSFDIIQYGGWFVNSFFQQFQIFRKVQISRTAPGRRNRRGTSRGSSAAGCCGPWSGRPPGGWPSSA